MQQPSDLAHLDRDLPTERLTDWAHIRMTVRLLLTAKSMTSRSSCRQWQKAVQFCKLQNEAAALQAVPAAAGFSRQWLPSAAMFMRRVWAAPPQQET